MKLLRRTGLYVDALFLTLAFTLGAGLLVLAQPLESPAAVPVAPQSTVPVNELVTVGTALAAWLLTEGLKRVAPRLPRGVIYLLPLAMSGLVTVLGAWVHSTAMGSWQNVVATILSAALAIAGNEAKTTFGTWGLTGKG